jgi:hypothetical protein
MMSDKKMLELAAKAAGIEARWSPDGLLRDCTDGHPAMNIYAAPTWNPLTDDGDALRLAVKLKLDVFFHTSIVEAHIAGGRIPPIHHIAREIYGTNPYVATRRAIVRAAAEIGKEMR